MGLFESIFHRPRAVGTPQGVFKLLNGYTPAFTRWSGEIYESELVRAAINARATHVSKLVPTFQGSAGAKLKTRLKSGPNEFQTWSQFLYRLETILSCQNTAYIVPVVDRFGEKTGLFPILPSTTEMRQYSGRPWIVYKFSDGQSAAMELSECGIMTRFQYTSDLFGESNRALDPTMDIIRVHDQGIKEGVKNSAGYRFMAQLTNFAKPDDVKKERMRFTQENLSREAGNDGLLLWPNTYGNIKQLETKPFVLSSEQQKLVQTNVFNYFGVNEKILQNSAFGDEWSAFYEGVVEAFAIQFSEVVSKMLFTPEERNRGNAITLTANRLQYMSNNDKLNVTAQLMDRGMLTINEAREIWQLPGIGEDGDVRPIRGEYYNAAEKTEGQ